MEQVTGLEPVISAWKANVLPLHYTCLYGCIARDCFNPGKIRLEQETGLSAQSSCRLRFALAWLRAFASRPLKTIHRIVFLTGLRAPLNYCPFIRRHECLLINGAGDGARTRHLSLGKAALYQMSYSRKKIQPLFKKAALYQMSYSRKKLPQTDCGEMIGAPSGIRTLDTLIKSQVL